MARKKKNDFWDDVEDLNTVSDNDQTGDDDTAEVAVDEEWSAVKSLPLKVIMRFLLMVSCLVAPVSYTHLYRNNTGCQKYRNSRVSAHHGCWTGDREDRPWPA